MKVTFLLLATALNTVLAQSMAGYPSSATCIASVTVDPSSGIDDAMCVLQAGATVSVLAPNSCELNPATCELIPDGCESEAPSASGVEVKSGV